MKAFWRFVVVIVPTVILHIMLHTASAQSAEGNIVHSGDRLNPDYLEKRRELDDLYKEKAEVEASVRQSGSKAGWSFANQVISHINTLEHDISKTPMYLPEARNQTRVVIEENPTPAQQPISIPYTPPVQPQVERKEFPEASKDASDKKKLESYAIVDIGIDNGPLAKNGKILLLKKDGTTREVGGWKLSGFNDREHERKPSFFDLEVTVNGVTKRWHEERRVRSEEYFKLCQEKRQEKIGPITVQFNQWHGWTNPDDRWDQICIRQNQWQE